MRSTRGTSALSSQNARTRNQQRACAGVRGVLKFPSQNDNRPSSAKEGSRLQPFKYNKCLKLYQKWWSHPWYLLQRISFLGEKRPDSLVSCHWSPHGAVDQSKIPRIKHHNHSKAVGIFFCLDEKSTRNIIAHIRGCSLPRLSPPLFESIPIPSFLSPSLPSLLNPRHRLLFFATSHLLPLPSSSLLLRSLDGERSRLGRHFGFGRHPFGHRSLISCLINYFFCPPALCVGYWIFM